MISPITPADRRPDAESHFIIAKNDRVVEPQPRRLALGRELLWILAASLAAHGLILLFLAWFSHAPLEADRLKETPVEVVVDTPKPPENGASAPPAQKAKPNSAPEAKTTGANPPESRPSQADPPETKPPAPNAAEAKPPASDPPEAKPEKAKAAPSKTADRNGAAQKQKESRRAERKPPPAQAKAATFERAAAENQAAGKNAPKREARGKGAADQWSDVGAQSHPPGGVRLPFDNGPEIFRAVAVPLPVEGGDEPLSYKEIVFGLLERAKQYPQTARERGARGSAVVSFVLDDAGELTNVSLVRSSGEVDLDVESLALVARAAPFPKPPPGAQRAYAAEITFGLQKAD